MPARQHPRPHPLALSQGAQTLWPCLHAGAPTTAPPPPQPDHSHLSALCTASKRASGSMGTLAFVVLGGWVWMSTHFLQHSLCGGTETRCTDRLVFATHILKVFAPQQHQHAYHGQQLQAHSADTCCRQACEIACSTLTNDHRMPTTVPDRLLCSVASMHSHHIIAWCAVPPLH